jgi:hypothetical protein
LLFDGGVIDGLGMKLLFDEVAQAHFLHGLDIARAWTERDAVEDVDDFIAVHWNVGKCFLGLDCCGAEQEGDACGQRQN